MKNPNRPLSTVERLGRALATGAVGALALAGCGAGGESTVTVTASPTVSASKTPETTAAGSTRESVGGTVYHTDDTTGAKVGVREYSSPKPRTPENPVKEVGHYNEGQTVLVECLDPNGRDVPAEVSIEGLPAHSTEWYKTQSMHDASWVPKSYVDVHGQAVPNC
jgi:hypothetical protein